MGTQWGPKNWKGPHGDLGPQMGTHVGAVTFNYFCLKNGKMLAEIIQTEQFATRGLYLSQKPNFELIQHFFQLLQYC